MLQLAPDEHGPGGSAASGSPGPRPLCSAVPGLRAWMMKCAWGRAGWGGGGNTPCPRHRTLTEGPAFRPCHLEERRPPFNP